ncbi:hypothetical protein, partial [Aliarcobacter butzleri]|uniref:hypothetical protein n=2 Tax=Aliarcobacter butzleri TaxID=28197 RepID=UPI0021B21939
KDISMNINFNKIFELFLPFIYITIILYLFSTILFFFLPKSGVTFIDKNRFDLEYKRYGFYIKSLDLENETNNSIQTLDRYDLKGIFSTQSGGFIIIEEKTVSKENLILSLEQKVNGYLLKKIFKNYVIFIKNDKEYILKINDEKPTAFNTKIVNNESINNASSEKNNLIVIDRTKLNSYLSDTEKIKNSIILQEVINGIKFDGFRVERILNDDFNKLGMIEGDIIKSVNKNTINSYQDLFKNFGNIKNERVFDIEILRDNKIMELNYEIN